jgi:excisionase family DNA binding protein
MHTTQTLRSGLRAAPGGQPALTSAEVMTPAEVAELLQLPISTVYYLARQGLLPHSRLGRTYRFLRPQLEDLLAGGER